MDIGKAQYWWELPREMREMIIERMDLKTHCQFMKCSWQCYQESLNSDISTNTTFEINLTMRQNLRIFRYELRITRKISTFLGIPSLIPCTLRFTALPGRYTKVVCQKYPLGESETCWKSREKGRPLDILMDYLKKYLSRFERVTDCIEIDVDSYSMSRIMQEIRIRKAKKLRSLLIHRNPSICMLESGFIDLHQLKVVSFCIQIPNTKINIDQLTQLNAQQIIINKTTIWNAEQIKKLADYWITGRINKNIQTIYIHGNFEAEAYDPFINPTKKALPFSYDLPNNQNKGASIQIGVSSVELFIYALEHFEEW